MNGLAALTLPNVTFPPGTYLYFRMVKNSIGVIHKLRNLIGGGEPKDDVIFWYTNLLRVGNKNIMLSATYISSHILEYVVLKSRSLFFLQSQFLNPGNLFILIHISVFKKISRTLINLAHYTICYIKGYYLALHGRLFMIKETV